MRVSALIVTYNQERYVAEAIESALRQEIDLPYEIVISEDCSTDNTRSIVRSYEHRYPDRIRVLYSPRNLGGVENFVAAWHECRGQYIALLEGDDYWTSPRKLWKQVLFLDAHPECAMCAHGATEVYEDKSREPVSWMSPGQREVSTIEDLLLDNFVYSCSAMLRSEIFSDFPRWVYDFSLSDVPLWIEAAQHGDIGFIREFLAVYRVHADGVWSGKDVVFQVEQTIELYERLNRDLNYRYDSTLARTLARFRSQLACEKAGIASDASILVVSEGDRELIKLYRPARHFPDTPNESETEALDRLSASGAGFLLVPRAHMARHTELMAYVYATRRECWRDPHTLIFELGPRATPTPQTHASD